MVNLVGYNRFKSNKKGKVFCIAYITRSSNDSSVVGAIAENFFMPDSLVDLFTPDDIGAELLLEYEFKGQRVYLSNVIIK